MGGERRNNAEKAGKLAARLFPEEKWMALEDSIYIAESRLPKNEVQRTVLDKELVQLRILTKPGSVAYLIPEKGRLGQKHPDAIVDHRLMELKTIIGNNINTLLERFIDSREQCENVFIKIDSELSARNVKRELNREIRRKQYKGGEIMLYFTRTEKIEKISLEDKNKALLMQDRWPG
jgi:hypothetical protein